VARKSLSINDRLAVASRVVAATVGGYAFANVVAVFLSYVLPMGRADAVLAMTLASFALYAAAVIWVFAARSVKRAWLGLLVPIAVLGTLAWLLGASA
jgi:Protein of unknown function (DUF3649)